MKAQQYWKSILFCLGITIGLLLFPWPQSPTRPAIPSTISIEAPHTQESHSQASSPDISRYLVALGRVQDSLEVLQQEIRSRYGHIAETSYRLKSIASLQEKIRVKIQEDSSYSLEDVTDLAGIRLIFRDIRSLYETAHELENLYPVLKRRDYILHPNGRGYRSLHLVVEYRGSPVEIQLRTEGMHRWNVWHHDLVYKNASFIKAHYGQKCYDEIKDYCYRISQYAFLLETGIITPPPPEPEHLFVLWNLAPEETRAIMTQSGAPDLSFLLDQVYAKKNRYP